MSWNETDHNEEPDCFDAVADKIDQLARKLAEAAGEDWDQMNNHPGYQKNQWRAVARMATA